MPGTSTGTSSKHATVDQAVELATAMSHIDAIRRELNERYIERHQEIDTVLMALIVHQHALFVGAPGQGKSGIVDATRHRIQGAKLYKKTVTPTTDPLEVMGMFDLPGMKEGHYRHLTANRLPEADVAFLDEFFNAGSALRKSLNDLMNEREYEDDGLVRKAPLMSMFAASNLLPAPDEDEALMDRFLLRLFVQPLSHAGREQLVSDELARRKLEAQGVDTSGKIGTMTSKAELALLRQATLEVTIPAEVSSAYFVIEREMETRGYSKPSPRRLGWLWNVVCANAVVNGRTEAVSDDLLPLRHCLWQQKGQIAEVASLVLTVAAPMVAKAQRVYDGIVAEIEGALVAGRNAQVQTGDVARDKANGEAFSTKLIEVNHKIERAGRDLKSALLEARGEGRNTFEIEQMGNDVVAKHRELLRLGGFTQPSWAS